MSETSLTHHNLRDHRKFTVVESSVYKINSKLEVPPIAILIANPNKTSFEISYGANYVCDIAKFHNKHNIIIGHWDSDYFFIKFVLHAN